ncbi:hypothetical protein NPX13_g6443 [Xylaria arbuscula]|uniref:Uncharacterized protein n=1 Tax=Xylaria arbuscula TaxID=114810 RepID=A0A9W8NCI0_9PEZI|nr:hypothetical protein NPX13_g6443 [Xylaria arbuscula]
MQYDTTDGCWAWVGEVTQKVAHVQSYVRALYPAGDSCGATTRVLGEEGAIRPAGSPYPDAGAERMLRMLSSAILQGSFLLCPDQQLHHRAYTGRKSDVDAQTAYSWVEGLVYGPRVPANAHDLGRIDGDKRQNLRQPREDDQGVVLAVRSRDNAASDRNPDETSHGNNGVAGGIVPAIVLRVTKLAHADRGDGDVVPGGKAEEHGEYDDSGRRRAEREPHDVASKDGNTDGYHVGVERADLVTVVPGNGPPDHRSTIQYRQARTREGRHQSSRADKQDLQHQWEYDAADATTRAGYAGSEPAAGTKEMAYSRDARSKEQGGSHPVEKTEGKEEMPILY